VIARARGRVDPETDRPARSTSPEALDLTDCVEVDVDRRGEEDVEVTLRDVRTGEADVLGRPAAPEGTSDLARRAGIDPDEAEQDLEDTRVRMGLECEPEPVRQPGAVEGRGQSPGVLGEPRAVIDEQRRPVPASERLGVLAGDRQAAVTRFEARPNPPRRERDAHGSRRSVGMFWCGRRVAMRRTRTRRPPIGTVDDFDVKRLEHPSRRLGNFGDSSLERVGIPSRWRPVVAHLADELESGGLDLAGGCIAI
jgi:hypothetical protein